MNRKKIFPYISSILLLLIIKTGYAEPTLIIADIDISPQKLIIKPIKKPVLHQFGGYINSVYVRFNVEIHNNQVYGQIFDEHGQSRYIYGEFYKGVLTIYDEDNNRLNVIVE